ncbi:Winged helix-turn helix [Paraburkholderia hospita]|nr:Winged helix-turn helix [Paraburkholderia hospita]
MVRQASGGEVLERAKRLVVAARTVDELRQAQAVLLPLEFGLTLAQTAQAIGVSVGWACQLRRRFILAGGMLDADRTRPGGRRRENMTRDEEAAFLAPFFEKARAGGILVVGEIKRALDERLGRKVALASAYNLLHRHGWRKLAPDKRHPKADVAAQQAWKKTPRPPPRNRPRVAGARADPLDVSGRSALRSHLRHAALLVSQTGPPAVSGDGDTGVHLRVCGRLGGRWRARLADPATRQRRLHADVSR